jgi:hypothetical protein
MHIFMEQNLREILDSLPANDARSRLEPYKEFVLRLRRQGRSYNKIRTILADRCSLTISKTALVAFVHRRSRPRAMMTSNPRETDPIRSEMIEHGSRSPDRRSPEEVVAMREAARAANHKPTVKPKEPPIFEYDPTRPLTNRPS